MLKQLMASPFEAPVSNIVAIGWKVERQEIIVKMVKTLKALRRRGV
jgi:hypothetical protein